MTSLIFDTPDGEVSDRAQTRKLDMKLRYHVLGSSKHNLFRKRKNLRLK